MLTYRARVVYFLSAFLVAASLLTASKVLAIFGLFFFSLVVVSNLFGTKPSLKLVVEREKEKIEAYEGEVFEVSFTVQNVGDRIELLRVTDVLPVGIELVEGRNDFHIRLGPGEKVSARYSVVARTLGSYLLGPVSFKAYDSMLFYYYEVKSSSYLKVEVYPRLSLLRRINIRPLKTKNYPGDIVARRPGRGTEFYGLIEYSESTQASRVNWKAYAKTDKLYVNQFADELGGDSIIVLDLRSSSLLGSWPHSSDVFSKRAAALISYSFLRSKNRVGVLIIGDKLVKLRPGSGRKQMNLILAALNHTTTGNIWEIENVPRYLSMFYSISTQVVFISTLSDDKSYRACISTALKGYPVIVLSPLLAYKERVSSNDKEAELALELVLLERSSKLIPLKKYAQVIDWNVTNSLEDVLRKNKLVLRAERR